MKDPSEGDVVNLKRLGRYLVNSPAVKMIFKWRMKMSRVDGYSDSDFAGSEKRTSTTGGVIIVGGTVLKSWCKQQKVVALSSGEAELYSAVKLGCELMGIKSLATDFGITVDLHMYIDAKATIGMLSRRGVGSLKHVETNQFWLQDVIRNKVVSLHKIPTDDNVADILTKYLGEVKINYFCECLNYVFTSKAVVHR